MIGLNNKTAKEQIRKYKIRYLQKVKALKVYLKLKEERFRLDWKEIRESRQRERDYLEREREAKRKGTSAYLKFLEEEREKLMQILK